MKKKSFSHGRDWPPGGLPALTEPKTVRFAVLSSVREIQDSTSILYSFMSLPERGRSAHELKSVREVAVPHSFVLISSVRKCNGKHGNLKQQLDSMISQ